MKRQSRCALAAFFSSLLLPVFALAQSNLSVAPAPVVQDDNVYEPLAASVQGAMSKAVSDHAPLTSAFKSEREEREWLTVMSKRLEPRITDSKTRIVFLKAVHYEANRAELDPQLVLSVIDVASGFKKYTVSAEGARGFMQVMPFWIELIGSVGDDLFDMRKNIRYGCTILRRYVELENGDLLRAVGRFRTQASDITEKGIKPESSGREFGMEVMRISKTRWRYGG